MDVGEQRLQLALLAQREGRPWAGQHRAGVAAGVLQKPTDGDQHTEGGAQEDPGSIGKRRLGG